MSKVELNPLASGYSTTSAINENYNKIESAVDDSLSRTGKSPNEMEADLDMNSNDILNANILYAEKLYIGGDPSEEYTFYRQQVTDATEGQTVLAVPTYVVGANSISVYVNGVRMVVDRDYQETDPNTITFTTPLVLDDVVEVVSGNHTGLTDTTLTLSVLGDSVAVFPQNATLSSGLQIALDEAGVKADVKNASLGGLTYQTALDGSITVHGGKTPVEQIIEDAPDICFIHLGFNDAFALGKTSAALTSDASAVFATIKAGSPNTRIVYCRPLAYDDSNADPEVGLIKNKAAIPFIHSTSTDPGETGLYTSAEAHLEQPIPAAFNNALVNLKVADAAIQVLPDVDAVITFDYFRSARLGFMSVGRLHPSEFGKWFELWEVWKLFRTDSNIRGWFPELTRIADDYTMTDMDLVWESAFKADTIGDGYDFDPDAWVAGDFNFPMWYQAYSLFDLPSRAKFWANAQKPKAAINDVNLSVGQPLVITLHDLFPNMPVSGKSWKEGDAEPGIWTAIGETTDSGAYIATVNPLVTAFSAGTWWFKYKIGNDVIGPLKSIVTGTAPIAGGSKTALVIATATQNVPTGSLQPVNLSTIHEDDSSIVASLTSNTITVDSSAGNKYKLKAHMGGILQHTDRIYSATFEIDGSTSDPLQSWGVEHNSNQYGGGSIYVETPWLTLDTDKDIRLVMLNTGTFSTSPSTNGVWVEVEVK